MSIAHSRTHWLAPIAEFAGLKSFPISSDPGLEELARAWEQIALASGLSERDLLSRVSKHFRSAPATLGASTEEARAVVPAELAESFGVLPLRWEANRLVVATADPSKPGMAGVLGQAAGAPIVFEVAAPAPLMDAIRLFYTERGASSLAGLVAEAAAELGTPVFGGAARWGTVFSEDMEPDPPSVVALSNGLFAAAVDAGASDMHLDPSVGEGVVRFRVDGVQRDVQALPRIVIEALIRRVRVKCGLPAVSGAPRETGIGRMQVAGVGYEMKLTTTKTADGDKASIALSPADRDFDLTTLGLDPAAFEQIRTLLAQPDGIFVLAGPTGSGITTLLYSILTRLAATGASISTLENPIEHDLPGVTQRQWDRSDGRAYSDVLFEILGQDADVLHIGEIRDEASAKAGLRAGITGRRVFGTVHSPDAAGALERLCQLGTDPAALAHGLKGVVAQRLLRRLCSCARTVSGPGDVSDRERALAKHFQVRPARSPAGCERCGGSGYRGQIPVTEVLVVTPKITGLLAAGAPHHKMEASALAGGMTPMVEQALDRVRAGETTLREVERTFGVARAPSLGSGSSDNVLIVDDAAEDRMLIGTIVKRKGLRALEAETAEVARTLLEAHGASLVLLDLRLPGEDGLSLLKRIRGTLDAATLPIIVLTSSQNPEDEITLLQAGADDYLLKPIDPQRLSVRIDAALRRVGSAVKGSGV